jgi:hypothetical protein
VQRIRRNGQYVGILVGAVDNASPDEFLAERPRRYETVRAVDDPQAVALHQDRRQDGEICDCGQRPDMCAVRAAAALKTSAADQIKEYRPRRKQPNDVDDDAVIFML